MDCDLNGVDRVNQFALVIYIPDPLAKFLDEVRRGLVPGCSPRAHVSVLPPRPLFIDQEVACSEAREVADDFAPFEIGLGDVEIFPVTDVVYISLAKGSEELRRMHRAMTVGGLAHREPFPYHPHVTLAQELPQEDVGRVFERARQRWQEYRGNRSFRADQMYFVQNTAQNRWLDLAPIWLGAVPVR